MPTQILSPLPGTFYRKPAPDKPPFKSDGDQVAVGEVIGLIEVMKSFIEVHADAAGKIPAVPRRQRRPGDGGPAARRGRVSMAISRAADCQSRRNCRARPAGGARTGHATIQVHSAADADSLAVRMADEAVNIGPPSAAKCYLNSGDYRRRAQTGAERDTSRLRISLGECRLRGRCRGDGPRLRGSARPDTIRTMGDKAAARSAAQRRAFPSCPARRARSTIPPRRGAGGGNRLSGNGQSRRGRRRARHSRRRAPAALEAAFDQAAAEAKAAFGDGALYLEKFIPRARHIEVQVLGDGVDAVHFSSANARFSDGGRKSGRRPVAIVLTPAIRAALCDSAVALAKSVGYRGAGTLEYLYDDQSGSSTSSR